MFIGTASGLFYALGAIPLGWLADRVRRVPIVVITGLLGTALAFTVQAWAQQFMAATNTALIFALEPVFAWITSFIVYGEILGWRAGAGAALILGGVLLSEVLGHPVEVEAATPAKLQSA